MVASYLQLLERRYKDRLDHEANEFIGFAVDGATRMKALILDLLTYSRVGSHGRKIAPVPCQTVLDRAVGNLTLSIQETGAVITHDSMPSMIPADDTQLVQLFQNLIANALKFHGVAPPAVHVGAQRNGREWIFSVRDNGIGIDPKYSDRIFQIFQRLHGRAEYAGTGIGLAICKKIVERHGGRIWVESKPGEGATFTFTIPMRGGDGQNT